MSNSSRLLAGRLNAWVHNLDQMLADMPTANCYVVESLPHRIKGFRIDLAANALKHEDFILRGVKQKSIDYILCCIVAALWVEDGIPRSLHLLHPPTRNPHLRPHLVKNDMRTGVLVHSTHLAAAGAPHHLREHKY